MTDLTILIPARNEIFLTRTIQDILENIEGDTEIIVACDGNWPNPPIEDNPLVNCIYHSQPIGQRAAVNEAAKLSTSKFIMKCDAHCSFDKGFDVKLMENCEYDWTVVPQMRNLHAFDWKCSQCGHQTYQGPHPVKCVKCDNATDFEMVIIWKPRRGTRSNFMRFDSDLHFQYWREFKVRPQAKGDIAETMSLLGAVFFMHRERYFDLEGLDERHGSWGQMGTEIACKTWLSGGRLVVNKTTWFAHMFRTQPGFGFPYPNPGIGKCREHSKWLWEGNNWSKAVHPLSWLIDKFAPVPDWSEEDYEKIKGTDERFYMVVDYGDRSENRYSSNSKNRGFRCLDMSGHEIMEAGMGTSKKLVEQKSLGDKSRISHSLLYGIVYYTDNRLSKDIFNASQKQIKHICNGHEVISVSLKPIDFGHNIVLDLERSVLTMFKQILAGLEKITADIVFLCEHDILYHSSHFDFTPASDEVFYYNQNTWKVDAESGQALFYYCNQTSGLCAYRELLLEHYQKRVERVEKEGFTRRMGFEPGTHSFPRGIDNYKAESWMSEYPNIDIRHKHNLTQSRWSQDQFRNQKYCQGWTLSDEVPGWGKTKNNFKEILDGILRMPELSVV